MHSFLECTAVSGSADRESALDFPMPIHKIQHTWLSWAQTIVPSPRCSEHLSPDVWIQIKSLSILQALVSPMGVKITQAYDPVECFQSVAHSVVLLWDALRILMAVLGLEGPIMLIIMTLIVTFIDLFFFKNLFTDASLWVFYVL